MDPLKLRLPTSDEAVASMLSELQITDNRANRHIAAQVVKHLAGRITLEQVSARLRRGKIEFQAMRSIRIAGWIHSHIIREAMRRRADEAAVAA